MEWNASVKEIKGVGAKRLSVLNDNGIQTVKDLLNVFPRKYLDRKHFLRLDDVTDSETGTITGKIDKIGKSQFVKGRMNFFSVTVSCQEKAVTVLYYNQPYLRNSFTVGESRYFYGNLKKEGNRFKMMNPQSAPDNNPGSFFEFEPVYGQMQGIPKKGLNKMIREVLKNELWLAMDLPKEMRDEYTICSQKTAYQKIHCPKDSGDVETAIKRFKYDEALKINMGILATKNESQISDVELSYFKGLDIFIRSLPFELTGSQQAVIDEIVAEMKSRIMINRLIQGDVGSGKTVIAVAIACLLAQNGYQIAYMAPTEILARQHFETFTKLLKNTELSIDLLTGGMKDAKRKELLKDLSEGQLSIIIGTHALFQEGVSYYNLGLVITDEQHRFGVRQKGRFFLKGRNPHTLVMSATPIPRTLSLILYGDLSVSYITERPKGRKPIKTHCYNEKKLPQIYEFVEKEIEAGRQAYVICPFVEASENMEEVRDIESVYASLEKYFKPEIKVGFLHGKMSGDDKAKMIGAFNRGEIGLLVATSIIEVGIDVANANTIVILNAERFGLAQLHQLRGRVGRGSQQSWCFLVTNAQNEETIERMRIIVNHHDGKEIAEADLNLRGPGDYFGFKQHGLPAMRFLNPLSDLDIIEKTREVARQLLLSKEREMMLYRDYILHSFYEEIEEISLN